MDTSLTAPDALDGFAYTSLADEDNASPTDLAPTETESIPPDSGATASPDPEAPVEPTAETPADATDPTVPATPPDSETPTALMFPEGGQPFAFSVDGGRKFSPEGAVQYPDGSVLLPERAWAQIRGGFLVDRESVNAKLASARQQMEQARQTATAESSTRITALERDLEVRKAALDQFQQIIEAGPEALLEWAQQFDVNKPILLANMRAAELEARLKHAETQTQTYTARETEQAQEAKAAAWRPELENHLRHAITTLAATDEFKGVAATPEAVEDLYGFLWETMADKLFYEKNENPQRLEDIGFNVNVLRAFLTREKKKADDRAAKVQTTVQSAVRNAGSLAPTPHVTKKPAAPPKAAAPKALDPDHVIGGRDYI